MATVATFAIYWGGLSGPLLFDDFWNFTPLEKWFNGQESIQAVVVPNRESIIDSRPVAMLSFVFTSWVGNNTVFALKLGNLLVHIACGLLIHRVLSTCLRADPRLRNASPGISLFLTSIWLLHPLHVSTVLYGVQRMAQLSTLFTLICVVIYLAARGAFATDRPSRAWTLLLVAFPAAWAAGILSKQNAVIAPMLCATLELAYFRGRALPRKAEIWLVALAALPVLAGLALIVIAPSRLLGGYAELEFTLVERILTQPRVLLDYIVAWCVPRTPTMGLYTDAYPISHGPLQPPSTLIAMGALMLITLASLRVRRSHPGFFAGWWIFLIAHSVESSILPLEMYYEHRNYLPSAGLLLALGAISAPLASRLSRDLRRAAAIGLLAVLAFGTFSRADVWQDEYLMTEQGLRYQPDSLRASLDRLSLEVKANDYASARRTLNRMLDSDEPRKRIVARLDLAAIDCMQGRPVDRALFMDAAAEALPRLTVYEVHSALFLVQVANGRACAAEFNSYAAQSLTRIIDAAHEQAESASNKGSLHRVASQLHALSGDWQAAEAQAQRGWDARPALPLGTMLAVSRIHTGNLDGAEQVLKEMDAMLRPYDKAWQAEMRRLYQLLDNHREAAYPHP